MLSETFTALVHAAHDQDLKRFKELWSWETAHFEHGGGGSYLLHFVVELDLSGIVRFMLENRAYANIRVAENGRTPIILNVMQHKDCANPIGRLLMKHGANPYLCDRFGMNAFPFYSLSHGGSHNYGFLELYLVVDVVTGKADSLPLDMWRVVKSFIYKL